MTGGLEKPEETRARLETRFLRDVEALAGGPEEFDADRLRELASEIVEKARAGAVNTTGAAWEQAYQRLAGDKNVGIRKFLLGGGLMERTREDDERDAAEASFEAGADRFDRFDYDAAAEHFDRALEVFERLGYEHRIAVCLRNLAMIDIDNGWRDTARGRLERAAEIEDRLGHWEYAGDAFKHLGSLAKHRGDLDEARELYGKALTRYTNAGQRDGAAAQWLMQTIREL